MSFSPLLAISLLASTIDVAVSQEDVSPIYFVATEPPNILSSNFGSCPIPRNCRTECLGNEDYNQPIEVDCSRQGFGPYIPDFGFYRISLPLQWKFDFSRNDILYIMNGDFYTPENRLPMNFTALDLSHNSIERIDADAFIGKVSENMTILSLHNNRLMSLEPGVFRDMPKLITLDLSHNMLYSIESLCASPVASLSTMNLANNHITYVQSECFNGYSALACSATNGLNLQLNRLAAYNPCAFNKCVNGRDSDAVKYNPFICGCGSRDNCINAPTTVGQNSTISSEGGSGGSCSCSQPTHVAINQSYPMDNLSAGWQHQNREKFIVKTSWEANSYSIALYQVTQNAASPWNTTVLYLHNSTAPAVNNTLVYQLERQHNWLLCVTPSGATDQQQCNTLRPPSLWEYPDNSVSNLSGFTSLVIVAIGAFFTF